MIVCLRTVLVPAAWRERYLAWIEAGREVRQAHGILAELVCAPTGADGSAGVDREYVVITIWPSHAVFDAWIATPHRDALTDSEVHRAVTHRPITRHEIPAGYLNLPGLTRHDPDPPLTEQP